MLNAEEFYSSIEIEHGRIENRKYLFINNLKYISGLEDWKDLRTIVKVESERIIKKTGETTKKYAIVFLRFMI